MRRLRKNPAYEQLAGDHREAVIARMLGVRPPAVTQALHRRGIQKYVESKTDLKIKFLEYMLGAEHLDANAVRKELHHTLELDAEERKALNYSKRRVPDKAYALALLISGDYPDAGMMLGVSPQGVWAKVHNLGLNDNNAVTGAFGVKLRNGTCRDVFMKIHEEIRKLRLSQTARH